MSTPKKKPRQFVFTPLKRRKAGQSSIAANLATSQSSAKRILEQTPSLKRLYEFLARPMP